MPDLKEAKIAFDDLPWETQMEGMRVKRFERDGRSIRLVEFTETFVEPGWCEKGHSGMVLEGVLSLDFADGHVESLKAGDGLYIPRSPDGRHKAIVPRGHRALLLLVDS